jgi:hypothetical protein
MHVVAEDVSTAAGTATNCCRLLLSTGIVEPNICCMILQISKHRVLLAAVWRTLLQLWHKRDMKLCLLLVM